MIHTPCKDCVFAIYDDKTQINCSQDCIDKYKKLDVPIVEVYDDDKEFYVIEGRKCI